jgi:hypothetical protein
MVGGFMGCLTYGVYTYPLRAFVLTTRVLRHASRHLLSGNALSVQKPQAGQYTKITLVGHVYDSPVGYGNSVYRCKHHRAWCVQLFEWDCILICTIVSSYIDHRNYPGMILHISAFGAN